MTIYNFSPGPAMLPKSVMHQAQAEFLNWQQTGSSVMEVSHRSAEFIALAKQSEQDLRDLLTIPDNYRVLFLPGGAQLQFAGIPMNLLGDSNTLNYAVTGSWGAIAAKQAAAYAKVTTACDMSSDNYTSIAPVTGWQVDQDAAYLYYCDNETVHGVEFPVVPQVDLPLVCDMSSNLLSRPVDVSKFGLIFACAQKNLGPAGLTIVIVRDDLLARAPKPFTPAIMDYRKQLQKDSMLNTPVTFSWYMMSLVFQWVKEQGGVKAMDECARSRSAKLYNFIDQSNFYQCPVDSRYRSRMNVIFDLADDTHNDAFLAGAKERGLNNLKGHRLRGGMRASIYNAMPESGVDALIDFMRAFQYEISK